MLSDGEVLPSSDHLLRFSTLDPEGVMYEALDQPARRTLAST
jgi:hypothetical protein